MSSKSKLDLRKTSPKAAGTLRKSSKTRQRLIDWLGGTVYLLWLAEWFWLAILYMDRFFRTGLGKLVKPDGPLHVHSVPAAPTGSISIELSTIIVILAVVATLIIIGLVAYYIVKDYVPGVQRTAQKIVRKTATIGVEQAVKHHVTPARKKRELTERAVFWIKMFVSVMPVIVVFAVQGISRFVPIEVARFITLCLVITALVFLILQKACMLAWRLKERVELAEG